MASARATGPAAALLAVVGGLVLLGAVTASWAEGVVVRDVAGAEVTETAAVAGAELAPVALGAGLLAGLAGIALVPARGRLRRLAGLLLLALGLLAGVDVVRGALAAAQRGALTAAPALAGLAVVAMLAGGALALRRDRPPPALPARFDLDEAEEAGEWSQAVDPRDEEP